MFEQRRRTKVEKTRNRLRVLVAAIFVLGCFSILIYRLWVLQVERYQGQLMALARAQHQAMRAEAYRAAIAIMCPMPDRKRGHCRVFKLGIRGGLIL